MRVPQNILQYCDELERVVHTDEPFTQRHISMLNECYAWLGDYYEFRIDNPMPYEEPKTDIDAIADKILEAWNESGRN